jgi:hypothetical protein
MDRCPVFLDLQCPVFLELLFFFFTSARDWGLFGLAPNQPIEEEAVNW